MSENHPNSFSTGFEEGREVSIGELEKLNYDMRNLVELGISLSSNLEFESLVESILFSCIGQMFIEKVAIILQRDIDIDSYYVHSCKGYDVPFGRARVILEEDSNLMPYLEKNPHPVEFEVLAGHGIFEQELQALDLLQPELVVPMISKNSINGLLLLGPRITGEGYSDSDKDFLRYLARFAAIAVENSRLYRMATLDRMTKLYIHHYFQQRLEEEIKRAERYASPLSLIITDIDHFKKFNDTYGHQQGDLVLKETARLIKESVRTMDIVARYGGEEFAIILPESSFEDSLGVADRIRRIVAGHGFPGQAEPLHVTLSLGVATYDMDRDSGRGALIKRADTALYRAKNAGRNRVAGFK